MVNRGKLQELVERLRASLPRNVQEADQLLEQREHIINQARSEAQRVRVAGEEQARSRVSDSEVVKEAEQRAEQIVGEAEERAKRVLGRATSEARGLQEESNRYAYETLQSLEGQLNELLGTVRTGMEHLGRQLEPAERDSS